MLKLAGCLVVASLLCGGEIRFSEIMYHPDLGGGHLEYLELEVVSGGDFTNYAVRGGVAFQFREGTVLPTGTFVILAENPEAVKAHYASLPSVPPHPPLDPFPYSDRLGNAGEELSLHKSNGDVIERVVYQDAPPWPFLADGFGKSLQRICFESDANDPASWVAENPTPGRGLGAEQCPPPAWEPPPVVINELAYHPNGGGAAEYLYEFVELHNRTDAEINLKGWMLFADGVETVLTSEEAIPPQGYLVLATNPPLFKEAYPDIPEGVLIEDRYLNGRLDNGRGRIALLRTMEEGIDAVTYADAFPWPIAPDGFGEVRGRGHSLERLCAEKPSGLVSNWVASPMDAATPGTANTVQTCDLPVIVTELETLPEAIDAADPITITVKLSSPLPEDQLRLVYATLRMPGDPIEPEAEPVTLTDDHYTATIPKQEAGTIIRWKIEIKEGDESWIQLSPRPEDPFRSPWHGLFIPPTESSNLRFYHLLIEPDQWATIHGNAQDGRAVDNQLLESWNESVPAIFAYRNKIWDVRVRYQGSQWHRVAGYDITDQFDCAGPDDGQQAYPVRLVSWRIRFPRYDQFAGRKAIMLNKLHQLHGLDTWFFHGMQIPFGFRLFEKAGVPAPTTRFIHMTVNGCFYHLMVELERPGDEMLERYFPQDGHLFKATGCPRGGDWRCGGPFDWADGRPLLARDGWSTEELYAHNYERKTLQFDDHRILIELIEGLDAAANAGDIAVLRDRLDLEFNVDSVLRYLATANWGCAWDDAWQNYYLYADEQTAVARWHILPWDMEAMFGGPVCCLLNTSYNGSIWRGKEGDPDNWEVLTGQPASFNRFKNYFFQAFPDEYLFRLIQLNNEVFETEELTGWVAADAALLQKEKDRSLLPIQGRLGPDELTITNFIVKRHDFVNQQVIPVVDAGDDFVAYAGDKAQFDASRSDPAPGSEVAYTWSNGMEGAQPTCVFQEPGLYEVELTITKTLHALIPPLQEGEETQATRSDLVMVRVLPAPACFYTFEDAMVVVEAESYHALQPGAGSFADYSWQPLQAPEASGGSAVQAAGGERLVDDAYPLYAPELDYWVQVDQAGPHVLWIRAQAGAGQWRNSFHVGLNHEPQNQGEAVTLEGAGFVWEEVTVNVPNPGHVLLSVWLRDPEVVIDKIMLTSDLVVKPEGLGPAASAEDCPASGFVRGEVNGDDNFNIADPVAILEYLFLNGTRVTCEDAADANDDGDLNVADPVNLLMYLFANGPQPKPPFPEPGFDPTPDDPYTCGDPVR